MGNAPRRETAGRMILRHSLNNHIVAGPSTWSRGSREKNDESGRVVAAGAPGVAAADAPHALAGAAQRPVLVDGLDHVLTTARLEAAQGGKQGPHRDLVDA